MIAQVQVFIRYCTAKATPVDRAETQSGLQGRLEKIALNSNYFSPDQSIEYKAIAVTVIESRRGRSMTCGID